MGSRIRQQAEKGAGFDGRGRFQLGVADLRVGNVGVAVRNEPEKERRFLFSGILAQGSTYFHISRHVFIYCDVGHDHINESKVFILSSHKISYGFLGNGNQSALKAAKLLLATLGSNTHTPQNLSTRSIFRVPLNGFLITTELSGGVRCDLGRLEL
jgi:hypothetical protein